MKKISLNCIRLVIIFLLISSKAVVAQTNPQTEDFTALQESVLDYVNQYRNTKGLKPLQMVPMITAEAILHSRNMGTGKVPFSHNGFEQRMDRIMGQIKYANACAENVAFGKFTAQEVVKRWIQSPGHKKNIEGNYNLTGVGIIRGKDGYPYFTQIFINQRNM